MSHPEQDRSRPAAEMWETLVRYAEHHFAALAVSLTLRSGEMSESRFLAEWRKLPPEAALLVPRLLRLSADLFRQGTAPEVHVDRLNQAARAELARHAHRRPKPTRRMHS